KLIKGAKEMLHKNVLIKACVQELKEQLAVITKRKSRKRKQIQHSGTLEYGPGASWVAAEACADQQIAHEERQGGARSGLSQRAQRRCTRCKETGHNSRTCNADTIDIE
ncbi:uncharacterized protein M421DRAFT_77106, partial [Didymella exigua CBS 183.55]